jgi:colanic acid/amylovoran biosynthesis glycosyltransferase
MMPLVSALRALDKCPMDFAPNDPQADDGRPAVVVYRSPLFNPSETFVRAHAESLARYRPLLAGIEDKGNVPPELRAAVFVPGSRARQFAARLGYVSALADRLRPHRPRLVHAHFGPDGLIALPLARALDVPLVTTLHGYDVARSRAHMLVSGRLSWVQYALRRNRLAREGTLFLAVSDALRREAETQGFAADCLRTHYLGVDLGRFRPGGEREAGLILHVGRLVEKKGTSVLLDAVTRLSGARLVIVGDGPERGRLERQAAGLGERVRFLGALDPPAVARWMQRASLLAAPSLTARDGDAEGLPTVILEASACGLPVVATRHSGIPEAVVDSETGFLVAEHDPAALAERIGLLLGSPELRERMGAAARRLAKEKFDLRRQTYRLETIYDEVLGCAS